MSRPGPGFGPRDAKLMIVGEAYGEQEAAASRPFVGPAGDALRKWLMETGIDPDSVYYDNLINLRPPGNQLSKWCPKGKPNQLLMEGLFGLMERIDEIRPNCILALGNYALHFLTGKGGYSANKPAGMKGITDWRGNILPCTLVPGVKVIPSYHPSYLRRNGMKHHGTFLADLARVREDMEFPELRHPTPEMHPAPSGPEKHMCRERLLDGPKDAPITVDIEFLLNKKTRSTKLICVGFADSSDWSVSFPTDLPVEFEEVGEILTCGRPLNMQNSMFDASILEWHFGWKVQPFLGFDTMVAAHASNIELPKGLDYLSSIHTREPNHKDMIDWNKVKRGLQPFSDVYTYNCIDAWVQHKVMEEQIKWDLSDERARRVFEFEMALLDPLWEVSKRGVRLDLDYMHQIRDELRMEVVTLNTILAEVTGRAINVKSPGDVAWLMHDFIGLPVSRKTKTGAPATDDKTLASYITKCKNEREVQLLMIVRDIRNRRDLDSKFFGVPLDEDQRSRGHYDPTKTVTGRLSSKKFFPTGRGHQQQNIPRDPRTRRCFIADEGKRFGYADLERAESLVVAHLANDPVMLKHHSPGVNAHRELGALLFDCTPEEVDKDRYYLSKQTRHAGNYMQGGETMKQNINQKSHITGITVTQAQCKEFLRKYKEVNMYLPVWWDETRRQLWQNRTLVNLLGRYRIFYDHIQSILPEAVAFVPQSTVGDTLNCAVLACHGKIVDHMRPHLTMPENEIIELSEALRFDWGWEMLNQVHDAIGYQYDIEYEYEVNSALRRLMTFKLPSPKRYEEFTIPVEVAVGPSWGEVEVWEEDLVST